MSIQNIASNFIPQIWHNLLLSCNSKKKNSLRLCSKVLKLLLSVKLFGNLFHSKIVLNLTILECCWSVDWYHAQHVKYFTTAAGPEKWKFLISETETVPLGIRSLFYLQARLVNRRERVLGLSLCNVMKSRWCAVQRYKMLVEEAENCWMTSLRQHSFQDFNLLIGTLWWSALQSSIISLYDCGFDWNLMTQFLCNYKFTLW